MIHGAGKKKSASDNTLKTVQKDCARDAKGLALLPFRRPRDGRTIAQRSPKASRHVVTGARINNFIN